MKILVTGAAGFIGSHLVDRLLREGHQVYGVDDLSNGRIENLAKAMEDKSFVFIEDKFSACIDQIWETDLVFHLAATGSVPRSIDFPHLTFDNNVQGFHDLLLALRVSPQKRIVYASSSSVYGGGSQHPNPQSPYALSKLANELYAAQYSKQYGIHATGLRFFNVYGPRQRADTEYSAFIPRVLNGEVIKINSPGTQRRDFTYVSDVVDALMLSMNDPERCAVYDVGYGEPRGIMDVVECLRRMLPERTFNIEIIERRPGDVLFSRCDNAKIKTKLGWTPRYSLEDGLKEMLAS
jgi:UDP-N-acetylglucosamine 4-epimerase